MCAKYKIHTHEIYSVLSTTQIFSPYGIRFLKELKDYSSFLMPFLSQCSSTTWLNYPFCCPCEKITGFLALHATQGRVLSCGTLESSGRDKQLHLTSKCFFDKKALHIMSLLTRQLYYLSSLLFYHPAFHFPAIFSKMVLLCDSALPMSHLI